MEKRSIIYITKQKKGINKIMTKTQLFALYNKMYENPEQYDSELRNMYFLTISLNGWWNEYYTQYPNEFGL